MVVFVLIVLLAAVEPLTAVVCGVCDCTETEQLSVTCIGTAILSVPQDLPANTSTLHLLNTGITEITPFTFKRYQSLVNIDINRNHMLTTLGEYIFLHNTRLSNIVIKNNSLLSNISQNTFDGGFHGLRKLDLSDNNLDSMPDLSRLSLVDTTLPYHLHLDGNPLRRPTPICARTTSIPDTCEFNYMKMTHTAMTYLPNFVLNGTSIVTLDLSNNAELTGFDDDVFSLLVPGVLHELILSDNSKLTKIPSEGISYLSVLKCQRCPLVLHVPPTIFYRSIAKVHLTYPQHCCAFRKPELQDKVVYDRELEYERLKCQQDMSATTTQSAANDVDQTLTSSTPFPKQQYVTGFGSWGRKLLQFQDFVTDYIMDYDLSTTADPMFTGGIKPTIDSGKDHNILYELNCSLVNFDEMREGLNCTPGENSFTPCVDILETDNWLRAGLWTVAILALLGNFVVLVFTISSRTKSPLTVTKFLICNLAFSDIMQGVYLLALAIIDIKTLGQYFNYATWWQTEGGCSTVGFITVFASELSVYTLSVITVERWYAISHAIHLTKRVQMRQAVVIMLIGWLISAALAAMPLIGFSSYEMTSLCLPFKFDSIQDQAYVWMLLILNSAAFILVFLCYVSIFLQVRGSNASMASDTYLARRMALLVFTDFFCWGPVAIVAAMSAGGLRIPESLLNSHSSLFIAKVVLVIFYPFNACANPFLYAIFTKQFRKDCQQTLNYSGLCKRKIRPIRRPHEDSGGSTRQNVVRNSQSHISNTTQLTNVSQLEHNRGSSIRSKSSVEALVACSLNGTVVPSEARRGSAVSIKDYAMSVLNSRMCASAHGHRKLKHGKSGATAHPTYIRSISCSASTIDSIDSRRPSDPVRVPETLKETDSINSDGGNEPLSRLPNDNDPTKSQWHRDRWLSDSRNKEYSDKSTDVDSGTEMYHISESECEDCQGLLHQNSITSSCSARANLSHRRASYSQMTNAANSLSCDSESECSCLTQYYPYRSCKLPRSRTENNNLAQEMQMDNHKVTVVNRSGYHEVNADDSSKEPLIASTNNL